MSGSGIVLNLDPVMLRIGPLSLYWYGLAYTGGFAALWLWLAMRRERQGWSPAQVVSAATVFVVLILAGGRLFEVVVYEWDWYRSRPWQVPQLWLGGMATHGLLSGAVVAAWIVSRRTGTRLPVLLDELAVPAAIIFGLGRIGNFIEGGVIGTPTALPWGVQIPGVEGFRHPVSLYDGLKNLALVAPLLILLRRHPAGTGVATGAFCLGYGGLRFLVDQFRDYESALMGIGPGQWFNLAMAVVGGVVLALRWRSTPASVAPGGRTAAPAWQVAVLVALVLLPLSIPTSWTRENIALKRETPPATAPAKP